MPITWKDWFLIWKSKVRTAWRSISSHHCKVGITAPRFKIVNSTCSNLFVPLFSFCIRTENFIELRNCGRLVCWRITSVNMLIRPIGFFHHHLLRFQNRRGVNNGRGQKRRATGWNLHEVIGKPTGDRINSTSLLNACQVFSSLVFDKNCRGSCSDLRP